jgi:uncharacterized damage-inducible protein DinB
MNTLREAFVHNDWARDKVLAVAVDCTDAELDRSFEMGMGTLRKTLLHLWQAERIWLDRWTAVASTLDQDEPAISVTDLRTRFQATAAERARLIDGLPPDGGAQRVSYTASTGETIAFPLGDMFLHVANHGVQHRAQAVNMLRRLGRKVSGIDYLYMRLERPTVAFDPETRAAWTQRGFDIAANPAPPVAFELDTLTGYFHYSDWANEIVWKIAAGLSDTQLDQPFEMGLGTLRKTLAHIRDAEEWWYDNWTGPPRAEYKLPAATSIEELIGKARDTRERRARFLAQCTNEHLVRALTIEAVPGAHLQFRLGESLMQLPAHGTHHRSQAVNMLRHLGAALPQLGYALYARRQGAA